MPLCLHIHHSFIIKLKFLILQPCIEYAKWRPLRKSALTPVTIEARILLNAIIQRPLKF